MIMFVVIALIIGIAIFLIYNHNKREKDVKDQKENIRKGSWRKILIIINICIICFFKFIFPGSAKYSVPTIWFYISILINIIAMVLLCNKKLLTKKKILNGIIIIYFLLMIGLPVYKFDDHEHVSDDTRTYTFNTSTGIDFTMPYEKIVEYTNYYNCYGLRIYKQIE